MSIQRAIMGHLKEFDFEGSHLRVVSSCAVFITMVSGLAVCLKLRSFLIVFLYIRIQDTRAGTVSKDSGLELKFGLEFP